MPVDYSFDGLLSLVTTNNRARFVRAFKLITHLCPANLLRKSFQLFGISGIFIEDVVILTENSYHSFHAIVLHFILLFLENQVFVYMNRENCRKSVDADHSL